MFESGLGLCNVAVLKVARFLRHFQVTLCQLQSLIRDSLVEYIYFSSVLCSTRLAPAYIG